MEDNQNKISSFDWKRKEIMSSRVYRNCCAKTTLGHQCTHRYSMYYIHKDTYETLFLCPIHEKKLLKDNFIEKFMKPDCEHPNDLAQNH
jgi:hypothetical protein